MADTGSTAGGLLGTLYVRFVAQTEDFNKKVDDTEKKVVKTTKVIEKAVHGLTDVLKALGLAWGIHEVVEFVHQTIEAADELKKFSTEIGIAIDRMAGLKFAADKANIGGQFEQGIRRFAASLREAEVEGSAAQDLFRNVLQIDPSQGIDNAFSQVIDRFSQWEDGVNKMGVAEELFGTRNARFINLLNQGTAGLNADIQELARVTGMSYEEAAQKSEEYNDAITTLKYAMQGLVLQFVNEALPAITDLVQKITDGIPQFQQMAKEIGTGMVLAVETLITSFKGVMGAIKVLGIFLVDLGQQGLEIVRFIEEQFVQAFEFWANAAVKSINFVISAFNSMADKLPDWVKEKLGISGGQAVKPLELFSIERPENLKKMDEWIDILHDTREDLANQLARDFATTAKVVKEGNEEVKAALAQGPGGRGSAGNAPNIKEYRQFQDRLNATIGDSTPQGAIAFQKMKGGLQTEIGDITGIQGDANGSFSGQAQIREMDLQLKEIQKLRESHFNITREQNERLTEMERLYAEKRRAIQIQEVHLRLTTASDMFGNLADITKAFAGQQSETYRVMFAISKAFAIADATVKIAQGVAAAAANPWPLNLFAMASVVAATASIVSSIQSVQLEFGGARATGGPVSSDKAFLVGEKGPEMFVPSRGGTIIPNDRLVGSKEPKVIINNYTDATPQVSTKDDGSDQVVEILLRKVETKIGSNIREGRGDVNRALQDSFKLRRGV